MTGDGIILWEAHRGGGGYELPESTPVGFEYAWMLGGTPEADVNATADGRLLSLHDGKLGRTAREIDEETGRTPIAELPYLVRPRHKLLLLNRDPIRPMLNLPLLSTTQTPMLIRT